ncbi:MAG: PepSY domain-containing protein [Gammaproteobacteria bacterium]
MPPSTTATRLLCASLLALGPVAAAPAHDGRSADDTLHECLRAARAIRAGAFAAVEFLGFTDEREAAYEITVVPTSGRRWEFECSARSGAILEIEQAVDGADDPLFAAASIDLATARATATRIYPGTVRAVGYEIQADGSPAYEFDIEDVDGVAFKIEVDAVSGRITEVQIKLWQIGGEQGSAHE